MNATLTQMRMKRLRDELDGNSAVAMGDHSINGVPVTFFSSGFRPGRVAETSRSGFYKVFPIYFLGARLNGGQPLTVEASVGKMILAKFSINYFLDQTRYSVPQGSPPTFLEYTQQYWNGRFAFPSVSVVVINSEDWLNPAWVAANWVDPVLFNEYMRSPQPGDNIGDPVANIQRAVTFIQLAEVTGPESLHDAQIQGRSRPKKGTLRDISPSIYEGVIEHVEATRGIPTSLNTATSLPSLFA